jgi:hypothetical protein
MTDVAIKGDEIMTDLQFKSIMELVNQILDRSKDLDDAKKAIKVVMGKPEEEKKEDK